MGLVFTILLLIALSLAALLIQEVRKQQASNKSSGKALRRKLARSRKEFIGQSESWHWRRSNRR
jgi:hypothetical protein